MFTRGRHVSAAIDSLRLDVGSGAVRSLLQTAVPNASSISGAAVVTVGNRRQPGRGVLSAVAFPFNLYFPPSEHESHMGRINLDSALTQILI